MTEQVTVGSADGPYVVHVGPAALDRLPEIVRETGSGRVALIYGKGVPHEHVERVAASVESADLVPFDDGEERKNLVSVETLCNHLVQQRHDRSSIAILVGGGTTGDAAGLAAATFMRGIPFVHVPTTLLAQVDSAIGGKLGVNLEGGKNLLGVFRAPVAVVSSPQFLETLSDRQWRSGFYEVIKAGVIRDAELFERLESYSSIAAARDSSEVSSWIVRAVRVKARIVSMDERESGERRLLNFGHTLGHGIEAASRYTISHGDAVAWGMLAALQIASARGSISRSDEERLRRMILRFEPERGTELERDEVIRFAGHDKKFREGRRVMILPTGIGKCEVQDVETAEMLRSLDHVLGLMSR